MPRTLLDAAAPRAQVEQRWDIGRAARTGAGAALLWLTLTPTYALLDAQTGGIAAADTLTLAALYRDLTWSGLLLLLPVVLITGLLGSPAPERLVRRVAARLAGVAMLRFASVTAVAAVVLSAAFLLVVLEARPNNPDSIVQLMHARYFAEGGVAGPAAAGGEFWIPQNSLFTRYGWVSQYPPGHVFILALFLWAGVAWLAGPVLVGVSVFLAALTIERLLPGRRGEARSAAVLLALSPFFLFLGASYMNHITACAGVTLAAYALCRAWQDERASWAVLAGVGLGVALLTRPLSAAAMGGALILTTPLLQPQRDVRSFARVSAALVIGALPFVALLAGYNAYFFGSPATFGYDVAQGPRMALGFHPDPWGNAYGVREALAYTSADLLALGVHLLETPLPAVTLIGVYLIVARRLQPGERVLLAWALAPVAANFFYWHHGLFMGPRMLHEAAPAWVFLATTSTAGLIRRTPEQLHVWRLRIRPAAVATVGVALALGLLAFAPQRAASYGGTSMEVMRTPVPQLDRPALVFVHDAWMGRIVMGLAAHGYSLDRIETLTRQNSTCRIHALAEAVRAGDRIAEQQLLAALDTLPRASALPQRVTITPGNDIRVAAGERLSAACERQVRSDRLGFVALLPLQWLGELPGMDGEGAMFVADRGPLENAALIAAYPQRQPWLYMVSSPRARPELMEYARGMRLLWGGEE